MKLEEFYNQINKDVIEGFIHDKQEEHLTLEFKTVSKANFSNRDDRKNFAKLLSGFANSNGGITVWGVEATRNQEGIDCACGVKEIQSLSQFLSKLNEFTGSFVNPSIEGVEHRKIVTSGDKGFAVTIVPESDLGPHMAKGGEDRYYKRSGDSFYKMEHFDIEDMFGRRKKPKLSLFTIKRNVRVESTDSSGKMLESVTLFGLKNTGRGIAKYIHLNLKVNHPYLISPWGLNKAGIGLNSIRGPHGQFVRYFGDSNLVIHPNSYIEITAITRKFREGTIFIEDLTIDAEIRAEDMSVVQEKTTISGKDLLVKVISDIEN